MYSLLNRLNAIVSLALTALAACAGTLALTTLANEWYLNPSQSTGSIVIRPTQLTRLDLSHPLSRAHYRAVDRMVVWLDVDADFTPAFNWNTKQVYVYCVAHYESSRMIRNEVTLWDTIITSKDHAKISFNRTADYFLDDFGTHLRGVNVTVRVWYHIMAHSGITFTREVTEAATSFIAKK